MHPRIAELFAYLDQQHAELRATVEGIPASRVTQSPAADGWSVVQVLRHLVLVEIQITRLVGKLVSQGRAQGLRPEDDETPILPTIDTARIIDRSRRIVAPESVRPPSVGATPPTVSEVLAALDDARAKLEAAVLEGDGLALGDLSFPHQVLGPLDMYQWIAFVGAHVARHTAQIREIDAALAGAITPRTAPRYS